MCIRPLPSRVARYGGAVKTFDEPRFAFKKVTTETDDRVARLLILTGTRVVYPHKPSGSWNNTKLRVESAFVDDIEYVDRIERAPELVTQSICSDMEYESGTIVTPDEFDPDTSTVSAPGIHCFPTRKGAQHWSP